MPNDIRHPASPADIDAAQLRILDKHSRLVTLRLNRAQRHLLARLTGRDIVLKARQLGISTAVQAWLFLVGTSQTARIATIAHDHETTAKLRDMQQLFYDTLPEDEQETIKRALNSATRTRYASTGSWFFSGTAGNRQTGRGGTYSHVHGSEVAFWPQADRILAGLLQGVPDDGHIILESTPNGAQGWFYDEVMDAHEGYNKAWTLHFLPWWMDDDYRVPGIEIVEFSEEEERLMAEHHLKPDQIAWRRIKQRELGELFPQEYPEDVYAAFLRSGTGYFHLHEEMFTAPHITAPARPDLKGHRFVAGLDFGQSNDYTVCAVIDATTRTQVDLLRIRQQTWQDIRRHIVALCQKWPITTLVAESNSMGSTNIEALNEQFAAANIPTAIHPYVMTHPHKTGLAAELRLALEEGGLKLLPDKAQRHELEIFSTHQLPTGIWQLSAPPGEHDDCVIALALAWHAVGAGSLVIFGT